jgi:hypothetical protein
VGGWLTASVKSIMAPRTVAEHLPRHLRVEGSNPFTAAGTKTGMENGEKKLGGTTYSG